MRVSSRMTSGVVGILIYCTHEAGITTHSNLRTPSYWSDILRRQPTNSRTTTHACSNPDARHQPNASPIIHRNHRPIRPVFIVSDWRDRRNENTFFHAPWCPQCRALEASIEATAIPAMVTIIKVDYDTNQSLRQQYGVTLQTTLVRVDDQGKLIKKLVAYDEPNFSSIEQLLN